MFVSVTHGKYVTSLFPTEKRQQECHSSRYSRTGGTNISGVQIFRDSRYCTLWATALSLNAAHACAEVKGGIQLRAARGPVLGDHRPYRNLIHLVSIVICSKRPCQCFYRPAVNRRVAVL